MECQSSKQICHVMQKAFDWILKKHFPSLIALNSVEWDAFNFQGDYSRCEWRFWKIVGDQLRVHVETN